MQRFGFDQHRRLRGHVGEPSAAAAGRANHEIAEVGTEAVRAAKQFAVMKNAEAQAALDVDDQEVVQVARLSEPVLGQGHQIDVAVDRSGHAEAMGEIGAERDIALLKDRALAANARRPLDDARKADADARDFGDVETRVADAAAHAVLDQIGDDRGGLAIDADRQRERAQDVGAEIGDRDRDLVGRELDAHHMRRARIELEHDPRPAASRVAHRADLQRDDEPVVEQRRGDGGDGRRAQVGQLRDLDPRHRAEATDRVHHVKAIDRAHQFGIGGLHRSDVSA